MRNVLIAVVCVLLFAVGGIAWHALRAPERVHETDAKTEMLRAAVQGEQTPLLDTADAPVPEERAPAGATPGTLMTFHVVDARSRQPIERFDLQVRSAAEEREPHTAPASHKFTVNPRGTARALCQPRSTVTVAAPGFATVRADVRADSRDGAVQTIVMERAGGIEGTVMFEGEPASRVRVFALHEATTLSDRDLRQRRMFVSEAESDGSGRFLVVGLGAGSYALRFEGREAATFILRRIAVPTETTVDIGEIVLRREAIVRGTIIPPVDQAPSSITVMLDSAVQEGTPPPPFDFEFRGLTAGKHELYWMRRDGGNTSSAPESRMLRLELQPGEVREVTVDATGGTTSRLTLRVRVNGAPAVRRFVRASTDLERKNTFETGFNVQSTTDANGVAVLTLRPGTRVRVDVFNDSLQALGGLPQPVELAEGEERELTLDLALGTLVVMLPSKIGLPTRGRVTVELRDALGHTFNESASTLQDSVGGMRRPVWASNRIEFGAFPAGSYAARVKIERIEEVTSGQLNWPFAGQPIRAPFETRVDLTAFLETVITVPD